MNNERFPFLKKHLCDFLGITEVADSQVRLNGAYELKPYRLAKSGGKTENYAIITQGQWELEFPNLIAEEGNSELNGTICYITFSMFYTKTQWLFVR